MSVDDNDGLVLAMLMARVMMVAMFVCYIHIDSCRGHDDCDGDGGGDGYGDVDACEHDDGGDGSNVRDDVGDGDNDAHDGGDDDCNDDDDDVDACDDCGNGGGVVSRYI